HLNHIYNLTNFLVSRLLSREQIHYLVTPHDAYVYGEEYKNKYMSFPKRWYRNIYVRIFDKYVLDNASVVHALTPQCTDSLSPLTRTPVEVVGNQVAEIASEFDVSKVKPQVCFIGR